MKKLILISTCLLLVIPCTAQVDNDTTATKPASKAGIIMTVRGPIRPSEFSKVLAHEHVMCDFIGAAKTGRHRYNRDDVVKTMLPFLQEVKQRGFTGFVDCTPAWLGRDVKVLRRVSEASDLHIVSNTGYYGAGNNKFLPSHALTESAEKLAARWIKEWEQGIDRTEIKPGFIKISVDKGSLSETHKKLVQAAGKAHLKTGLTIACHTGEARAALGVLETVRGEGVDPSALIIVHADGIFDRKVHFKVAEAGAWVEYDGVSDKSIERHVGLIKKMLKAGYGDHLLISHDAGWYRVGEGESGKEKIRPFTAISDKLIPALKAAGLTDAELHKLFVDNPATAFTVGVRKK
jgi:phosphotriesterase-related protein